MKLIEREPNVAVGLMTGAETVNLELKGEFAAGGVRFAAGKYQAVTACNRIELIDADGRRFSAGEELKLSPVDERSSFVVRDVVIGIDFHWEQKQDQQFQGALAVSFAGGGTLVDIGRFGQRRLDQQFVRGQPAACGFEHAVDLLVEAHFRGAVLFRGG